MHQFFKCMTSCSTPLFYCHTDRYLINKYIRSLLPMRKEMQRSCSHEGADGRCRSPVDFQSRKLTCIGSTGVLFSRGVCT